MFIALVTGYSSKPYSFGSSSGHLHSPCCYLAAFQKNIYQTSSRLSSIPSNRNFFGIVSRRRMIEILLISFNLKNNRPKLERKQDWEEEEVGVCWCGCARSWERGKKLKVSKCAPALQGNAIPASAAAVDSGCLKIRTSCKIDFVKLDQISQDKMYGNTWVLITAVVHVQTMVQQDTIVASCSPKIKRQM